MRMATDYDAPRRTETDEVSEDSLEELKARRNEAQSAVVDVDESESAESFELPGADLSGEELSVRVIPKQADGRDLDYVPAKNSLIAAVSSEKAQRALTLPSRKTVNWLR